VARKTIWAIKNKIIKLKFTADSAKRIAIQKTNAFLYKGSKKTPKNEI
jgi:hypothetical protein